MTYRIHYSVTLRSSVDFDAPDKLAASCAAREWLRRTHGTEISSVWIERVEDKEPAR